MRTPSSALRLDSQQTSGLPLTPAAVNESTFTAADGDMESLQLAMSLEEEEAANSRRASSRVASSEKVECRKRWLSLLSKIGGEYDCCTALNSLNMV